MEKIIKAAVDRGASDLHIKAGDVFRARIDGRLVPLTKQRLTPEQTRAIAARLIPNEEDRAQIDHLRDYDCSWGMPGIGRFRVNVLRQRSSFMIVMRVIPFDVPTFESLDLPSALTHIATVDRGLVLVAGTSGSGKSSTVAAMINHINLSQHKHILTIESPIEFLHRDVNSSVTQREVGVDTPDYRSGLRAALRQDPDVIVIGDLPDAETIDIALKAAETGRLVISTLNAPDVATALARLIAAMPAEEQPVARLRLSETLQAIVAQRLLNRADGRGRVAALELLMSVGEIREVIRDPARLDDLHHLMGEYRDQHGTQTFDQHLADLTIEAVITHKAAVAAATDPEEMEEQLESLRNERPAKGRKRRRKSAAKGADAGDDDEEKEEEENEEENEDKEEDDEE